MILSNLALELESSLDPELKEDTIDGSIQTVIGDFLDEETGLIYENRNLDGSFLDTFYGGLLKLGHGIEAMWFMMDSAKMRNDSALSERTKNVALSILDYSWDSVYGGKFYFMDSKGFPPQLLDWDQKLWWVHLETLIALIKGYELTGDEKCLNWFNKVHENTWSHFSDPDFPNWYSISTEEES
jgi:N-acylglucosamine 2-epimerase